MSLIFRTVLGVIIAATATNSPGCDEALLARLREKGGTLQFDEESSQSTTQQSADNRSINGRAIEDPCPELLAGPPRGLACIHCSQLQAREQAREIIDLMFQSCLKNIATNFLLDGTFSIDQEFLKEQLQKLSANDRQLFLYIYLMNGSAQRRWEVTSTRTLGTTINPKSFRKMILNDPAVQKQYQRNIERLLPLLKYAHDLGIVVSLIPGLEDNLSDEAFSKLVDLTVEVLPPGNVLINIGRSACPNCYDGNEEGIPPGVFIEKHTVSAFIDVSNGVISNDGIEYDFPKRINSTTVTLDDLRLSRDAAGSKNNAYILWSSMRQGLGKKGATWIPPHIRNYSRIGESEKTAILEFLREGLSP